MVAQGPGFSEAAPPAGDKALVYFYWPRAFASAARTADIYVDGKQVASINAGGYAYAYVSPEHHEFYQKWAFNPLLGNLVEDLLAPKSVGFYADLHPGETRYVRFMTGVGAPTAPNSVTLTWGLHEVTPDEGRSEIATERYQKPD